jgi:LuxR family maltose regulon positive regulatory protein
MVSAGLGAASRLLVQSKGSMPTPLLITKLLVPPSRKCLVARPHLLARLDEGAQQTLTLVCAPAGYGKTTLLSEWIACQGPDLEAAASRNQPAARPARCWVTLDEGDNDPVRFLSYLQAALAAVEPGVGAAAAAMVRAFPPAPPQSILTALINDLHAYGSPVVVILDDYQCIANPAIHEGLAFFLDHLPPNVHVMMATRSDPPLPLARLRARSQLVEVRVDDLRFSEVEAAHLLQQVAGLELGAQDIMQLEQRTEGWAAGLQMAGLALKGISESGPSGTAAYVAGFSGTNRYILDYLVEEILRHQPDSVHAFLLQTSILESLCGPLCDAVTERQAGGGQAGQVALEQLERANLFLMPLDADRRWFRYHRLFADLLRARLRQQYPEQIPALHLRAAEWYEHSGHVAEAVDHALAAGAHERACGLIEAAAEQLLIPNGMAALLGWIDGLPPELAQSRPWLSIARAWACLYANSIDGIEPLAQAAERNIRDGDAPELQQAWRGHIGCLRAFESDARGDVPRTIEMAGRALDCLPPGDVARRTFAQYMLGRAHYIRGELEGAVQVLAGTVRDCMRAQVTNVLAPSLSLLSIIYRLQGRLRDSIDLLQTGRAFVEQSDPRRVSVAGAAYVGLSCVRREWNDLAAAEVLAQRSVVLNEPWRIPSAMSASLAALARVYLAQGKLSDAGEMLQRAESWVRGRVPFAEVTSDLNALRVDYWRATGQLSNALEWARGQLKESAADIPFSIPREQDEFSLVRALLANGDYEPTLQRLDRLAAAAEAGGRFGRLLEARLLQALALDAQADRGRALKALDDCLNRAEAEKYCRIFVSEGEPMRALLRAYVQAPQGGHKPYAQTLLAAFALGGQAASSTAPAIDLIEPLNAREREILHWLAEGCTNRQIADKLFLAKGTVKFYVHSILEKFGVHTRAQAVIEAKKRRLA